MQDPVAIVLAAGKSTRMNSDIPKVLHPICGRAMIEYVFDAVRAAGIQRIIVVVGHQANDVRTALSHHTDVEFAYQAEQNGTGHAVKMCAELLKEHSGPVLILAGDTPFLTSDSLSGLLDDFHAHQAACVIGTAETEENEGLGRIVRDENRQFAKIVEQRDATPEIAAIQEINTGCFVFDGQSLLRVLDEIKPTNNQNEYYLTDCPEILKDEGQRVIAADRFEIVEAIGVNTPEQLADAEQQMSLRATA